MIIKIKFILLLFALSVLADSGNGQSISVNDSTTTFKNQEGKILSKEEAQELMKGIFSTKQENIKGKKIVTIIPGNDERAQIYARMEIFKNNLINKPVKAFQFTDLDENKWKSKELKGKVVVINFWFTACKPCIMEMPLLNELVAANKDRPVVFLAPALENTAQVAKFLTKYKFDYKIIPSSSQYSDELGIEYFPTHFVIDKEGIIKQVIISYSADIKEKLQTEIDKLIN